jgi:hypothetical protein
MPHRIIAVLVAGYCAYMVNDMCKTYQWHRQREEITDRHEREHAELMKQPVTVNWESRAKNMTRRHRKEDKEHERRYRM